MNSREWLVRETDEAVCKRIAEECGLLPFTAKILYNRGLTEKEEISVFLERDSIPLYDPFLLKDMDKAVARINEAIDKKQHICIYGDYDVDGVTSTVMLYLYLCSRGVECEYFIPERISEGYGLSRPVIEKMKGATGNASVSAQADELIATIDKTLDDFTVEAIAAGREYSDYRMNQCIAVSIYGSSLMGELKTVAVFAVLAYISAIAYDLSKKFPKA